MELIVPILLSLAHLARSDDGPTTLVNLDKLSDCFTFSFLNLRKNDSFVSNTILLITNWRTDRTMESSVP